MKKILALLLFTLSATAMAQHGGHGFRHGHWNRGHGGNWIWMVPAAIGGAIVYEAARQQPPIIIQQQQPVVVTPNAQNCSPWTEVQNPDGSITRTRTCIQ
jgi:hypothetical protein